MQRLYSTLMVSENIKKERNGEIELILAILDLAVKDKISQADINDAFTGLADRATRGGVRGVSRFHDRTARLIQLLHTDSEITRFGQSHDLLNEQVKTLQTELQQTKQETETLQTELQQTKQTTETLQTELQRQQKETEHRLKVQQQGMDDLFRQFQELKKQLPQSQITEQPQNSGAAHNPQRFFANKSAETQATPPSQTASRAGLFRGHQEDGTAKALLHRTLPESFFLGTSFATGDSFFDALAQSLRGIGRGPDTAKALRKLCHDYVIALDQKGKSDENWIYQRFLAKAERLHPQDEGEAIIAASRQYQHYMANIHYTAFDASQGLHCEAAIGGEPDRDGRILREVLEINLHIVELQQSEEGLLPCHQLNGREREPIDYQAVDTAHLVVFNGHFVPLLAKAVTLGLSPTTDTANDNRWLKRSR